MEKKFFLILLLIITIWGGLIRFYNLSSQSLWIDEGFSIQAAKAVLEKGYPEFDNGEIYRNFVQPYIIAGSIKLFGFDAYKPFSARLPSAMAGILLIPMTYLLTFLLFKKHSIAFLAALLMSFNTAEIGWSRQARDYASEQLFSLLSFVFLWLFIEKRKVIYAIISLFTLLIAVATHLLSIVFIPSLFVFYLIYTITRKDKFQKKDLWILIPIISLGVFTVLKYVDMDTHISWKYYARFLFSDWFTMTISTILGIFIGLKKKEFRYQTLFLTLLIIIPIIIFSFAAPLSHLRYLVIILPFMFSLSVFAIWSILEFLLKDISLEIIKIIISIILTIFMMNNYLTFRYQDEYNLGNDSPLSDFKSAHQNLEILVETGDVLITAHPHMTELYLGTTGMWLPFSLSGKKNEIKWSSQNNKERVTGAPVINEEELFKMIDNEKGYVLIDQIMAKRIKRIHQKIADHPNVKLVYNNVKPTGEIWIFSFGK